MTTVTSDLPNDWLVALMFDATDSFAVTAYALAPEEARWRPRQGSSVVLSVTVCGTESNQRVQTSTFATPRCLDFSVWLLGAAALFLIAL